MFSAPAKRPKLFKEKECSLATDAESGFHSEIDFSSSAIATSKSNDESFALSPAKRRVLATRRASLNQISLSGNNDSSVQHSGFSSSSGYSSLLSSSSCSSNLTSSATAPSSSFSRQQRTPKKRKVEISASDENFYNSPNFVSPLKIRKRDDQNCAKLVLKEKCSSENVIILSSTPIQGNKQKWQKSRSFHPERIRDACVQPFERPTVHSIAGAEKSLVEEEENSLNLSGSFNFSNASFNLTSSVQLQHDIPTDVHHLWTDDIKPHEQQQLPAAIAQPSQESQETSATAAAVACNKKKRTFYNGLDTFNILGRLNANNDIALNKILDRLDDESLLSLSHVSKEYRKMVQSNKTYETKRLNYLEATNLIKENRIPTPDAPPTPTASTASEKKRRKAFHSYNRIENQMTLRNKPQSPTTRYNEMQRKFEAQQKVTFKKCPRCRKPATIKKIKIRHSPRKKKINILSLSATSGCILKRPRTFLSKTTVVDGFIDSPVARSPLYATLSGFDDELSRSPNRSSSCDSPNSSSSCDDMDMAAAEMYEYGVCGAPGCSYKFCVKCNCKYHPRQQCADLSPPSPNRFPHATGGGGACTRASRKSLRRLAY